MKNMTRKQFLEAMTVGVAGIMAPGLMTGCSSPGKRHRQNPGPVKILSFGDMHLLDSPSTAYPRKVIQAMNAEGGDLVLACGDLGTDGKRSELELARDVLDELTMPYYPVVGNHDALYTGEQEETLFSEIFSLKQNNYHFVTKGIHFIAIDHGCGKKYRDNSVRPRVMAWIKETLTDIPDDEPMIFFSHYPFAKGITYQTKNAADVQALFKGRKLLAMVGAHFHGNTEQRENGILMTTTACCSGTRGNHDGTKAKGYRVFHIDNQMKITTEFKEVK
ncbi:MAG: metallophosphoesterase [Phycisphaerae bacterium]|nr:metallophosphoesterase [Phycisphaerae bacterium]